MGTLSAFLLIFVCFPALVSSSTEDCQHHCLTSGTCKATKFADTCYYLFNDKQRTWRESRELCASENLTMAKMEKNATEQNFIINELIGGQKKLMLWLGGRTYNFTNWSVVNTGPLNETNSNGTSKYQDEEDTQLLQCGILQIPNKTDKHFKLSIENEVCNKSHQFICRFDDWHNTPSMYISEQGTTWPEAKSRCADLGGKLFRLNLDDDIQHVEQKLLSFPGKIFFVELHNKTWVWEDGSEILCYNWLDNEPTSSDEICILMYSWTAKWRATSCNGNAYAFCQSVNISEESKNRLRDICPVVIVTLGGLLAFSMVLNIFLTMCLTNGTDLGKAPDSMHCDVSFYDHNSVAPGKTSQGNRKPADSEKHSKTKPTKNPYTKPPILTKTEESNSNPEISEEMEILDNSFYGSVMTEEKDETDVYEICTPELN